MCRDTPVPFLIYHPRSSPSPLFPTQSSVPSEFKAPGETCDNFGGYCDTSDPPMCVSVDNDDVLNDLLDIFTLDTLFGFLQWLRVYWYIPVAVIVFIAIIMALLHCTYRRRKPLKKVCRGGKMSPFFQVQG